MRAFWGLVRKEFIQVFRDRNMLRIIFIMPIIQLMLFGYVVNTDVKLLDLDVYDFDRSSQSHDFINSMKAGDYFVPTVSNRSLFSLEDRFKHFSSEMALIIPEGFSEHILKREKTTISVVADGTNSSSTGIGLGYAGQMTRRFSEASFGLKAPLEVRYQVLYNPEAESVYFMVPGIVATLLTMVTVMLTSMAIVREREMGTLEQLVVTPISGRVLLLGKLVPFGILGLFEMTVALTVGVLWFHVPFVGSPIMLFIMAMIYLVTVLGIGLVFSTTTSTQQQAMFFAWFFNVFAMLTSGFFTPISNMPQWMQYITYLNPMRFFMAVVRGIMMKGSGPSEMLSDIYPLLIYGIAILGLAVTLFVKRTK